MCNTPFNVKNPRFQVTGKDQYIPVPCGKCPACKARRTSGWSFRMMQETLRAKQAHFITFTYETPPRSDNGFPTLRKEHWQLFMKRLRFKLYGNGKSSIKYYACGEYGSNTHRPHYHAVIYNVSPTDVDAVWRSMPFNPGHTFTGSLTYASAGYVAKYINKGTFKPLHERDDRVPEFSLMSKGLGSNYLTPQKIRYHKADISRNYIVLDGGQKVSMPRYFRLKLYDDDERSKQAALIVANNEKREADRLAEHIRKYGTDENYNKSQHEAVRSFIDNFNKQQNRKDL